MNRTRAAALRTDDRPRPGRKHGGGTTPPISRRRDGRSSNKFLGTQPDHEAHEAIGRILMRMLGVPS